MYFGKENAEAIDTLRQTARYIDDGLVDVLKLECDPIDRPTTGGTAFKLTLTCVLVDLPTDGRVSFDGGLTWVSVTTTRNPTVR